MDRLAAVDRRVVVAPDEERPQPPGRLLAVERGTAVEVLLPGDAEIEAGFERVVARREVGAEVAVALLEAKRVEDAIAARRDPVLLAGSHQAVPHLHGLLARDVELEAELADVRDPLRQDRDSVERDLRRTAERQRLGGDVVLRDGLQHRARLGPPEADHGDLVRLVADLHRCVAGTDVEPKPSEIGIDGARSRDHAEPLLAQARDGEVGDDPAPVVQELRVDD